MYSSHRLTGKIYCDGKVLIAYVLAFITRDNVVIPFHNLSIIKEEAINLANWPTFPHLKDRRGTPGRHSNKKIKYNAFKGTLVSMDTLFIYRAMYNMLNIYLLQGSLSFIFLFFLLRGIYKIYTKHILKQLLKK